MMKSGGLHSGLLQRSGRAHRVALRHPRRSGDDLLRRLCHARNLAQVRTGELECACAHIGIRELRWLDWPDGGVKDLPRARRSAKSCDKSATSDPMSSSRIPSMAFTRIPTIWRSGRWCARRSPGGRRGRVSRCRSGLGVRPSLHARPAAEHLREIAGLGGFSRRTQRGVAAFLRHAR